MIITCGQRRTLTCLCQQQTDGFLSRANEKWRHSLLFCLLTENKRLYFEYDILFHRSYLTYWLICNNHIFDTYNGDMMKQLTINVCNRVAKWQISSYCTALILQTVPWAGILRSSTNDYWNFPQVDEDGRQYQNKTPERPEAKYSVKLPLQNQ